MAKVAGRSTRTIKAIRANLRCFGNNLHPKVTVADGSDPLPLPMVDAVLAHLEKPDQYLDELAVFLWDEFEILVTVTTIGRLKGNPRVTSHRSSSSCLLWILIQYISMSGRQAISTGPSQTSLQRRSRAPISAPGSHNTTEDDEAMQHNLNPSGVCMRLCRRCTCLLPAVLSVALELSLLQPHDSRRSSGLTAPQ
jgi:hypothetical protein